MGLMSVASPISGGEHLDYEEDQHGGSQRVAGATRKSHSKYGESVRQALAGLWAGSGRVCSKRLKPLIATLLPSLVRHGRLADDPALHALLAAISPATIDRLLAATRYVDHARPRVLLLRSDQKPRPMVARNRAPPRRGHRNSCHAPAAIADPDRLDHWHRSGMRSANDC